MRLADEIDEQELREQLDHARTLRFAKKEMIWLAGNTFYGSDQIFEPEFLDWLDDFRAARIRAAQGDGQYELDFHGPWTHTTMWEIPALAIINELRSRAALKGQGRFALDVLYARAKAKMWSKVERLRKLDGLRISDFGTRRRHSFLWQRWCVEALKEGLGGLFTGTSNVLLAMDNDLEAIGTNAHELPMVLAALRRRRRGAARGALPHPRGLGALLWRQPPDRRCPTPSAPTRSCATRRTGSPTGPASGPTARRRSRPARRSSRGGKHKGRDPREKLLVFSDALDVEFDRGGLPPFPGPGADVLRLGHQPHQRLRRLRADRDHGLDAISLVCKVTEANGRPAVKLSDNPAKATGSPTEIERYLKVFGDAGRVRTAVVV